MSDFNATEPTASDVLDIQHDPYPADDHGAARRIPHLGHLAMLVGLCALSALICVAAFAFLLKGHPQLREAPVVEIGLEGAIYVLTLAFSFKLFPLLWKRSFLSGVEFNSLALRRNWPKLVAAGILLCALAQLPDRYIHQPQHPEMEHILSTPSGAWAAMLLGVLLAPFCEELVFRGFLLPALATAYDWLSLERTPAALERWRNSTTHTMPAQVFAALLSSLAFALLHAPQNRYAWGIVGVLFCVGLGLAYVRVRTHSLACSTLVHMVYNGTLFAVMLVATGGFRHMEKLQ